MIEITEEQLVQVFEDWENDYRSNPDTFLTQEECAEMEVAVLSERCAICFKAYLRQRVGN